MPVRIQKLKLSDSKVKEASENIGFNSKCHDVIEYELVPGAVEKSVCASFSMQSLG